MKTEVKRRLLLFVVVMTALSLKSYSVSTMAVRIEEKKEPTITIAVTPTTVPTLHPTEIPTTKKYPWGKKDTVFGTGVIPKLEIEYPIKLQESIYEVTEREAFVIHKVAWMNRNSVVLMIHHRGYDLNLLNEGDIFVINSPEGVFTYSLLKKETYTKIDTKRYEKEVETGEKEVIDEEDLALRIYVKENQGLVLQSCIPSPGAQIKILFLTFKRVP